MTQEEKAKAYDEALLRADEAVQKGCLDKDMFDIIFPPEESEDERIRKKLIETIGYFRSRGIDQQLCEEFLAYLEKQEQKPAEWSEEDEKMIERLITRLNWITYNTRTDGTSPNITFFDEIDWLKSLRPQPKQEWSEQNKKWFDAIIKDYDESLSGDEEHDPAIQIKINLLKSIRHESLRPCPSWKPSEEQVHAIVEALKYLPNNKDEWMILDNLADTLMKLM